MKKNNFFKLLLCLYVVSFLSSCVDLASNNFRSKLAESLPKSNAGQVYAMRGGLGGIFSKGMNHLENTLRDQYNIRTYSTIWYKVDTLAEYIADQHAKGLSDRIILVGHSLGANDQIKVAQRLNRKNIKVALLITVDAVAPLKVPPNVKEVLNFYKPSFVPMFSGLVIRAEDPKKTLVNNLNVDLENWRVNHFTIDKNVNVQKKMVSKILVALNQPKSIA